MSAIKALTQNIQKAFFNDPADNTRKAINFLAKNGSYVDLLTYSMMLDDATILHKDGAISCSFRYYGPDIESETDALLDDVSMRLQYALGVLKEGYMFEVNLTSKPAPNYIVSEHKRDVVSEIIDIERRAQMEKVGTLFETQVIVTFTYLSVDRNADKLAGLAIEDSTEKDELHLFRKDLKRFKHEIESMVKLLDRLDMVLVPLKGDELLTTIYQMINVVDSKIHMSKTPVFLDSYLSEQNMVTGLDPMIGNKHIAVLSLDDFPKEYYPVILQELSEMCIEFRWSTRFIPMNNEKMKSLFTKMQNVWRSRKVGLKGMVSQLFNNYNHRIDEHAQDMEYMADAAVKSVSAQDVWGLMTSTIILADTDTERLDDNVNEIIKVIKTKGFAKVRREDLNATDAFIGSLPSHGGYNVRMASVPLDFFVDIIPTTGIYTGMPYHPHPVFKKQYPPLLQTTNRASRIFNFNSHDGDVGHLAIHGPTSTGKSVLMGLLMSQHYKKYPNSAIFGFDYNYSLKGVTLAHGGKYFSLKAGNVKFSPFAGVDNKYYCSTFLLTWLENIYQLTANKAIDEVKREALIKALKDTASMPKEDHRFDYFITQVMNDELQSAFTTYAEKVGEIFNGSGDQDTFDHDWVMFDGKSIIDMPDDISIPIRDYIFYAIDQVCHKKDRLTMKVIDEADNFTKHDILDKRILDILRRDRHVKGYLVYASQNITDPNLSKDPDTYKNNIATQILLPNRKMGDKHVRESYLAEGLNEQEITLLSRAIPKRDYFVRQAHGKKMMSVEVGSLALEFLGITLQDGGDGGKLKALEEAYDANNDQWAFDWLAKYGKAEESSLVKEIYDAQQ